MPRLKLAVLLLGLFGTGGPLPLHLTAHARDRRRQSGDDTFIDFCDLLQHRLIALFYRAWADARPHVQHDRPELDRFRLYVGALAGFGLPALRDARCPARPVQAAPCRHDRLPERPCGARSDARAGSPRCARGARGAGRRLARHSRATAQQARRPRARGWGSTPWWGSPASSASIAAASGWGRWICHLSGAAAGRGTTGATDGADAVALGRYDRVGPQSGSAARARCRRFASTAPAGSAGRAGCRAGCATRRPMIWC